jgi:hypothetical protein
MIMEELQVIPELNRRNYLNINNTFVDMNITQLLRKVEKLWIHFWVVLQCEGDFGQRSQC